MRLGLSFVALSLAAASCGEGSDDGDAERAAAPSTTATSEVVSTTTAAPTTTAETVPEESEPVNVDAFEQRVVLFGAEELLADALALGVEPVASSSTLGAETGEGFTGIPDYVTTDVEVLSHPYVNFEQLAALEPDIIVGIAPIIDGHGPELFEEIADTWVVPHDVTPEQQVRLLGEAFGRSERAEELVAELEAAATDAAGAAGDCDVSIATIYAGPEIAVFVGGSWPIPWAVQTVGCELVPTPAEVSPDDVGRATISLETLGLLSAPDIVLMHIAWGDEIGALEEVTGTDVWQALPAVQTGNVHLFDRIGFRGIEGRIRALDEMIELFGES
ncbi:MAG: ABC transporter substrate-binding protein [Actinomycetota bacterium]|nr:ABC transporter substrate-binding protein [Actinomycetota bacterium]